MPHPRISLFCLVVMLIAALPSFAADDRAAAERAAFEREWKEVVAKYPRVAQAYAVALQTAAKSMNYIYASDPRAFTRSAWWIYEDLCDGQGMEWTLCKQPTVDVTRQCGSCKLECLPPGSALPPGDSIGCTNCQLKKTECEMELPSSQP